MEKQRNTILKLLQSGNVMSKLQFINGHHILNPGARIEELRNRFEYPIEKIMVKNKYSKRKFAVYFIRPRVKDIDLILRSYNN